MVCTAIFIFSNAFAKNHLFSFLSKAYIFFCWSGHINRKLSYSVWNWKKTLFSNGTITVQLLCANNFFCIENIEPASYYWMFIYFRYTNYQILIFRKKTNHFQSFSIALIVVMNLNNLILNLSHPLRPS